MCHFFDRKVAQIDWFIIIKATCYLAHVKKKKKIQPIVNPVGDYTCTFVDHAFSLFGFTTVLLLPQVTK